jgi:glycosyltransferase involved in cell wall biosynthesis
LGDRKPGRCLLVLGMHRSGTSALTRVLNLLGAALPRQLLPAASDNPSGFWEGYRFVLSHDEALARAGLRWFDPGPLRPAYFASAAADAAVEDLARLVADDFGDAGLFAVKDPRICRLVPLWRRVLDRVGSPISPILAIRDPRDVAESMLARNRLPLETGHMLWLRHVLEAEAATRDLPRTIVGYDDLLADWRQLVERLATAHPIQWPERNPASEAAIDRFLSPTLRHHHRRSSGDRPLPIESEWSQPVYHALLNGDHAALDRVRYEIERVDRLYGSSMHLAADWTEPRIPELIAGLERAKHEIAQLRARAKYFGEQVARRESELSIMAIETRGTISELRLNWLARLNDLNNRYAARLGDLSGYFTVQYNDLTDRYNQMADRYNAILASTSWRYTSPLRHLAHAVKGGTESLPEAHLEPPDPSVVSDLYPPLVVETAPLQDAESQVDASTTASLAVEAPPLLDRTFADDREAILWSGLWQPEFYRANYPDAANSPDLLDHFLESGAALGYKPNPWFDTDYYRSNNPRLAASGENALIDYIRYGAWAGPDPHPSFKTERYLDIDPQLRAQHMTPLSHFLRYELPAAAPDEMVGALPESPRALYALAPLDPGDGWMWQRLLEAGALIPRTGSNLEVTTDLFGDPGRPKLLVASHELSRTGAPLVLLALLKRFYEQCDAEIIVFSDRGGDLVSDFARYAHILLADAFLPFSAGGGIADIPTILAKLDGPKPLASICNTANTEHYGRCFKQFGVPVVMLMHEVATPYAEIQVQRLFETADQLVAVSEAARNTLKDKVGAIAEPTIVIPPGLLKPELLGADAVHARDMIRRELGLSAGARIVLTCGTMDQRKGVDVFLQAARRVIQTGDGDVYFVWVGGGSMDRTLPAWWARYDAAVAGFGDRIRFVGERLDTAPWYLAADLFLLTSREDPMPCVVIEAMAAGLPVITFRGNGGASEAIGTSGGVVSYLDIEAMADATKALLNDPERRHRLGAEARRRVRELYDFDDYFERICGLMPALGPLRKPSGLAAPT